MSNSTENKIRFTYLDKEYCLEYTRDSVKQMEAAGFNVNDIGDKPATRLEQLWAGAFIANHRKTSASVIKILFDKMKNKELLFQKLAEMYNNTLSYLLPDTDEDDEGNVDWTASL